MEAGIAHMQTLVVTQRHTVVSKTGKETCESGRIGLPAKELTW